MVEFLRRSSQPASPSDTNLTDKVVVTPTPGPATDTQLPAPSSLPTTPAAAMDLSPAAAGEPTAVTAGPPPPTINAVVAAAACSLLGSAVAEDAATTPNRVLQRTLYLDALRYLARGVPRDDPAAAALAAELHEIITGEDPRGRRGRQPVHPRAASAPYRATRALARGACGAAGAVVRAAVRLERQFGLCRRLSTLALRAGAAGCRASGAAVRTSCRLGDDWLAGPARRVAAWLFEGIAAGLRDGVREAGEQRAEEDQLWSDGADLQPQA